MNEPFHAYDIRSVYGAGIDAALAYRIGRALARHLDADRYLLGHDARTHSPALADALGRGLAAEGRRVASVGLTTTPALHYLQLDGGYDAAVMATASHNPPQYHGFKVFDGSGGSVSYAKGLSRVEELLAGIEGEEAGGPGVPLETPPPAHGYVDLVAAVAEGVPMVNGVVDVSNGSAGALTQAVADRLGGFVTVLNGEPDGTFPAHPPNPLEEASLCDIAPAVRAGGAAFGAILDGDGDRVMFVDERGEVVAASFSGALLAGEMLRRHPGAAIVHDLIASRVFAEEIAAAGGRAVRSPVGYTQLYDVMVDSGAVFGCETSGHLYFRVSDAYFTESALYAVVMMAALLARGGRPLSALVDPLRRRYAQSAEINLPVGAREEALAAMERIRHRYRDAELDTLDGLSVAYDHVWFTIRPSNTEPLLRLRLEGRDAGTVAAALAEVRAVIEGRKR
jgi:phosphomannomutase